MEHTPVCPSVLVFIENRYISYSGKLNYIHMCTVKILRKKKTSSVCDCTVEDVEYICNSNSTLCLFYFAIFVILLLS